MIEEELDQDNSAALRKSLADSFGSLTDYRRQGSIKYRLLDILFITICAVTSGANDLKAVAMYAERKERWLKEVLKLPEGVPSYATFWTVFALLCPTALEHCFVQWVRSRLPAGGVHGCNISIDGKAQRGTAEKGEPHSFVHIVSAWATSEHLTLGQLKVDGKSNEISAIPQLLDMIDIEGATVTIDAMGCQIEIAKKILIKGGDYLLSLKGNQGLLSDEVENYFEQAESIGFEGIICDAVGSQEHAHGRYERREVYTTEDIDWLPQKDEWQGLRSIVMVKSERTLPGQLTSVERRYYISSLEANALRAANTIRGHWGIREPSSLDIRRCLSRRRARRECRKHSREHVNDKANISQPPKARKDREMWDRNQTSDGRMGPGIFIAGDRR